MASSSTLELKIRIPSDQNKTLQIPKLSSDTVLDVKTAITLRVGIPRNQLLLIYNGEPLVEKDKQLANYNINNYTYIYLLIAPFEFSASAGLGHPLKITLRMPDWEMGVIDFVEPWFTVRDIKTVMGSKCGFPWELIALSHGGKLLEDDARPFTNGHFDAESPFFVLMEEPKTNVRVKDNFDIVLCDFDRVCEESIFVSRIKDKFEIVLRDCDRMCEESIFVSSLQTVLDIKKKIGEVWGIYPVRLFHGKNTPQLDDEKTLGSYEMKDKSVIWLLGSFLKLYIKVPAADTMLELKVCHDYIVDDIKHMLFEKTGIPVFCQTLVYGTRPLDNSKSLQSYNIIRNSTIYAIIGADEDRRKNSTIYGGIGARHKGGVEKQFLFVSVAHNARHISILVMPWYTIFDVKVIIESASEILICHQNLFYDDEMLEDWKTIEHYGIGSGSSVLMILRQTTSQIFLNFCNQKVDEEEEDNKPIIIEAKSFDNLDDVMNRIPLEQIEKIHGQPYLFLDEASQSGNKLLAQFEIESGLILSLDCLIQINVRDVHGDLTKVDLKPWYDINKAKMKVEERCGIPCELQMLTYGDEELDDKTTLGDCEQLFGSLWNLRWKCGGSAWSFFWPSYDGSNCSKNMGDKKMPREIKDFHGYL